MPLLDVLLTTYLGTIANVYAAKPKKSSMKTQSVILSKDVFKSKSSAVSWLRGHKFKSEIDETGTSYRARQIDPGKFKKGSIRTITLTKGVKATVGKLK